MSHRPLIDASSPIPFYYQVYKSLLGRIEDGEFRPGDSLPAERRLVEEYGVSRITIGKALEMLASEHRIRREHGRGTFVNEATAGNGPPSLAFISGVTLHPYIHSVLMGAAHGSAEQGHGLQVVAVPAGPVSDETVTRLVAQNFDGAMIYARAGERDLPICRALQARGVPLLMIDRYYDEVISDRVLFDEEIAAHKLTQRLIARGHRRVAFVTHFEVEASSVQHRMRGYRQAMRAHGLDDDELIWLDLYADLRVSRGQVGHPQMTTRLLDHLERDGATAIVAINHDVAERLNYDLMLINAERARRAVSQRNGDIDGGERSDYEIRPDLAAFAYRDLSGYSPYHMTIALQPGEELGRRAVQQLITRLDNPAAPPVDIRVPLAIVESKEARSSSALHGARPD